MPAPSLSAGTVGTQVCVVIFPSPRGRSHLEWCQFLRGLLVGCVETEATLEIPAKWGELDGADIQENMGVEH